MTLFKRDDARHLSPPRSSGEVDTRRQFVPSVSHPSSTCRLVKYVGGGTMHGTPGVTLHCG